MGTAHRAELVKWVGRRVGEVVREERRRNRRFLIATWVGIVLAAVLGIVF